MAEPQTGDNNKQVNAIFYVFIFDLSIFLLELAIFFCIRKKRGDLLFNFDGKKELIVSQDFEDKDIKPSLKFSECDDRSQSGERSH